MWYYVQCDLVLGGRTNLVAILRSLDILEVRYLFGLMVWLYIYFISDLHNGWTKYTTKWSEAELSVFKSEFSSSFGKVKDSITVKLSDINARSDEIEKKKKISYRGS